MTKISLTDEMRKTVNRCIWFEEPEKAIQDIPRLAAYILTYGLPEDTQALLDQFREHDLEYVLDNAPAGIYDKKSWAYWNLMAGRYETPPMPERTFSK